MDKNKLKTIGIVILVILLLVIGFVIGRYTIKTETKVTTEYITLPAIHDTITKLIPKEVYFPVDTVDIIKSCVRDGVYVELFPEKVIIDTIHLTSEDTLKILRDWATIRKYSQTIFDSDTLGSCSINLSVQYNRLDSLDFTYIPIQKQVNKEKVIYSVFDPFFGVGMSVGKCGNLLNVGPSAEIGAYFKKNYGVSLQYQYLMRGLDNANNTHEITAKFLYKL